MTQTNDKPRAGVTDRLRRFDDRRVEAVSGLRRRWSDLPRGWRVGAMAAFLVVLYALPNLQIPFIRTTETDFTGILFLVAVYVLIAVGLNVVVGLAGLLDLGYIGFFAVGAYTVAIFGSPQSPVVIKYPWIVCIPLAIALTMISGVLLGWPTLRLRGDYLAIVTLGFGEIIRLFAVNSSITAGNRGITGVPVPPGNWPSFVQTLGVDGEPLGGRSLFSINDTRPFYWLALTAVLICMYAVRRLENSRVGRSWLAIREDEDAAEIMGVPSFRFKLWAFAIGAALGGLSGALFATKQTFFNAETVLLQTSILYVAAVVVGGAGNLLGVTIGAVIIAYLPERFREFADYRYLIFGLALIAVMIFRPQGILPSRRRAVELADRAKEAPVNG
ncbi:branched-chain amino acid ABC transporter permease [Planosporangium flavigriseum]|uniref:High-affinity branched-chain amino acid ABC transporter (LivM) n=1 Tax=Planosporangium flavigriseum TaxID=373681 RepID=A0A8J3LL47_9ACTN|nr:branched-chain amino acid ABC transporter permease [Planosporangium flavigriseum]GIG73364.1 high-affinity branched-chain amino acid ABC transporter (LivM) [Planosporangium flavigriseum]